MCEWPKCVGRKWFSYCWGNKCMWHLLSRMPKYQINATHNPNGGFIEGTKCCCCIDNGWNGLSPHIGECLLEDKSNFEEKGPHQCSFILWVAKKFAYKHADVTVIRHFKKTALHQHIIPAVLPLDRLITVLRSFCNRYFTDMILLISTKAILENCGFF